MISIFKKRAVECFVSKCTKKALKNSAFYSYSIEYVHGINCNLIFNNIYKLYFDIFSMSSKEKLLFD